ncbi:MAG TPA: hypothetical protein VFI46_06815 [Jiangellaceae bacterium]|nr:hypothetical protein [Jiangellaceae bacterium]
MVRTRRVRAIEERFYGRVARTLYIGVLNRPEDKQVVAAINGLSEAAAESASAHAADELRCLLVHARIPIEDVRNFWAQVQEVARRFAQIPGPATRSTASSPASTPPTSPPSPTPSATRPTDATGTRTDWRVRPSWTRGLLGGTDMVLTSRLASRQDLPCATAVDRGCDRRTAAGILTTTPSAGMRRCSIRHAIRRRYGRCTPTPVSPGAASAG